MKFPKFITIEGIEGAGKSTVSRFIKDYFVQLAQPVISTREPGGTEIAEAIRQILLMSHVEPMQSDTELLLIFASRMQHIGQVIAPNLQKGTSVVCDRYIDATYAYQGGGRGIDLNKIALLDKMVVKDLYPDLTILLDLPPEIGFTRTEERGSRDRIESEQKAFFLRVRQFYLDRAKKDLKRIKVIDATRPLEQVEATIKAELDALA